MKEKNAPVTKKKSKSNRILWLCLVTRYNTLSSVTANSEFLRVQESIFNKYKILFCLPLLRHQPGDQDSERCSSTILWLQHFHWWTDKSSCLLAKISWNGAGCYKWKSASVAQVWEPYLHWHLQKPLHCDPGSTPVGQWHVHLCHSEDWKRVLQTGTPDFGDVICQRSVEFSDLL